MAANHDAIVLALEVTGPEAERLGAARRKEFGAKAATIGRAGDNDWVLPHRLVSGHHAVIEYANGTFSITDTSTNGVFINSKTNRLTRDRPTPINSGDAIIIEPFRIEASIGRGPGAPVDVSRPDPFQIDAQLRPSAGAPAVGVPAAGSAVVPGDELDPLRLLGVTNDRAPAVAAPRAQDLDARSPLEDHFRPPAPVTPAPTPAPAVAPAPRPAFLIPDDYDPAAHDREVESQPPTCEGKQAAAVPVVPQIDYSRNEAAVRPSEPPRADMPPVESPRPAAPVDLVAVLAGAGLEGDVVTAQLATNIGTILRVVVSGLMDVLRARQDIKDEFRMRGTRIQPRDNNPLKFSANVSDALHNLLVKRNPAYLGPVEAFEDAFNDLREHQLAMLAGMRDAFESMLGEFDPDRLQAQFDGKVKKKSLLGSAPEVQYWEMYRERAQDLIRDMESAFRDLFGERFVSAYEEQLKRLKDRDKAGR